MARAIATAELRVRRSRGELRERLRRLGSRLSRPPSLVAAAAAGALAGFAIARRGGLGALASTLGAALLRHGVPLYVRYRTAQAEARGEDGAYETLAPNEYPGAHPGGLALRR